jgi:small subunit ribosomal protein S20
MANHKATQKDTRQAAKRRERNRYYGKTTRNAISELREQTRKGDAEKNLITTIAMIDKLVKKGIIHKNKAANLKSGLVKKVNGLK